MPNPLYVDEMAEQVGTTQPLIVLRHNLQLSMPGLPWQPDRWASVTPDHAALLEGSILRYGTGTCQVCGVHRVLGVLGLCRYCERSQAAADAQSARRDDTVGRIRSVTTAVRS